MFEEAKLIVDAIEGLKQEDNLFKDYIFPIASALCSSFLGGFIAYYFFHYQERIKIEKEKIDTVNKWILLVEDARSKLIAIKQNYYEHITEVPIQRALVVPTVIFTKEIISDSCSALSFIVPKSNSRKISKWSQIFRIKAMITNYNSIQELWCKRNEIERPLREAILKKYTDEAYVFVTLDDVVDSVGKSDLASLVDLTEKVVRLMDDIIVEMDDFLANFPVYAKSLIDTKLLRRYGSVLTYSNNNNEKLLRILKKSPKANYKLITNLFGVDEDTLEKRYTTGYEKLD